MYEYECPQCGHSMEEIKSFDKSDEIVNCTECETSMKKIINIPSFRMGDGYWARNNYQNSGKLELDAALKENDVHRKNEDKLHKQEYNDGFRD